MRRCTCPCSCGPITRTRRDLLSELFERLKSALQDRYTIESQIGAGGMAVVYRDTDLKHSGPTRKPCTWKGHLCVLSERGPPRTWRCQRMPCSATRVLPRDPARSGYGAPVAAEAIARADSAFHPAGAVRHRAADLVLLANVFERIGDHRSALHGYRREQFQLGEEKAQFRSTRLLGRARNAIVLDYRQNALDA